MSGSDLQSTDSNHCQDDDEQERQHFQRIVDAFRYYRTHSIKRVLLAERCYKELPSHHKDLVPNYTDHLQTIRVCIDHNYEIIKLIISYTDNMFENKDHGPIHNALVHPASEFDMDKVKSTLKQFVRDWSAEGKQEREDCYDPVIREILERFPPDQCDVKEVSVLVPGAGLGRLAFEIASKGYTCQGNEFSLFMLFASNFILNKCKDVNMYTIYPWVHQYSNNNKSEDQVHAVQFPDVNPSELISANFSMSAGDFLEVYKDPEAWDCVATVFFIDTAHNIISYIETIWHTLKPGGYWINLGPLLYHFADMPNESSIELSYEEVRRIVKQFNFEIVKEKTDISAGYIQNPRSMLKYQYDCVFFVARKPLRPLTCPR